MTEAITRASLWEDHESPLCSTQGCSSTNLLQPNKCGRECVCHFCPKALSPSLPASLSLPSPIFVFLTSLSPPLPHLPVLWFVLPFTWATADIPWERQRGKGFRGETTALGPQVTGRLGWQGTWGGRREVRRREEGGGKEGTRRWKKTGGREPQSGLCRVGPPAGKKSLGVR